MLKTTSMAMPITEPDCIPQTLSRQLDQILLSRYYFILYQSGIPEEYLVIAEEFLLPHALHTVKQIPLRWGGWEAFRRGRVLIHHVPSRGGRRRRTPHTRGHEDVQTAEAPRVSTTAHVYR